MRRHTVTIGSKSYVLAQGHGIEDIRGRVQDAVHAGGAFVEFVVLGNRQISALITAGLPVIIEAAEVEADERDTGDVQYPFVLDPFDI
jgi:hypothetical protein